MVLFCLSVLRDLLSGSMIKSEPRPDWPGYFPTSITVPLKWKPPPPTPVWEWGFVGFNPKKVLDDQITRRKTIKHNMKRHRSTFRWLISKGSQRTIAIMISSIRCHIMKLTCKDVSVFSTSPVYYHVINSRVSCSHTFIKSLFTIFRGSLRPNVSSGSGELGCARGTRVFNWQSTVRFSFNPRTGDQQDLQ